MNYKFINKYFIYLLMKLIKKLFNNMSLCPMYNHMDDDI